MQVSKTMSEGAIWVSVSNALMKVSGLAYIAIVLSHISVYEYGVTELVITIPAFLGVFNLPGLDTKLTADIGYEKGRGNVSAISYMLSAFFSLRVVLGVIAALIIFLLSSQIAEWYNEAIANMIRLIALTFIFSPIRTVILVVLRAGLHFKTLSGYRFIEEISKLVIVFVGLVLYDWGPIVVIMAYVGADIVATVLFGIPALRFYYRLVEGQFFSRGWRDPFSVLAAHGKWSILVAYLNLVSQNIRPWIIKFFLGTQAVGLYGVAMGMYQHTASLLPVSRVVAPVIPRYLEKPVQLYRLLHAGVKYQTAALVLSALVMVTVLPFVIERFFPDFALSWWLYLSLLPALIPSSISSIIEPTFHALKAQKDLFVANITRTIAICVLLPVSLLALGPWGIGLEFLLTRSFYVYQRYKKLQTFLPDFTFSWKAFFSVDETDRLLVRQLRKKLRLV